MHADVTSLTVRPPLSNETFNRMAVDFVGRTGDKWASDYHQGKNEPDCIHGLTVSKLENVPFQPFKNARRTRQLTGRAAIVADPTRVDLINLALFAEMNRHDILAFKIS